MPSDPFGQGVSQYLKVQLHCQPQWNTLSLFWQITMAYIRQNLSYQTNQFSFEGIHCFHGNDRSHSLIWETSQHQTQFHKDQIQ